MSNCSNAQEILQVLDYKLIKSLFVGLDCRHMYRDSNNLYAYSDTTGRFYVGLDRDEAGKRFNAASIKPKVAPNIEDIDATLKQLEADLKTITKRVLNTLSDALSRQAERIK